MSGHIFISYKHEDDSLYFAYAIRERFLQRNLEVWFDKDIGGGRVWSEEIDQKIESCLLMIVIVTKEALKSDYVTYEWAYALGLQKTVIPLLLEGSEKDLHARMARLQYRDFRGRFREPWNELLADVERVIDESQTKLKDPAAADLHDAVKRITSHLQNPPNDVPSPYPSTFDSKMLRMFLELAPPKILNHLRAKDLLEKDFDQTSGFKTLFSRILEINEFSQLELSQTMKDETLAQHLMDCCEAILYFDHDSTVTDDVFIDMGELDDKQNAIYRLREAYRRLVAYVRRRYPGFQFP